MRPIPIVLVCLFAAACGPTTQAVPTPPQTETPPSSLTASPSPVSSETPGPVGSRTPIPLTTATPLNLSTPTPFVSPATAAPLTGATSGPSGAPFGPFAKLDSFPANGAFEVTDVSVTPGGYIAVGFGGLNGADYDGVRQGIVWTSVDGMSWSQSVDPSLVNVSPFRVVAKGSDLFMLGSLSACAEFDENCTDVPQAGNGVWRSTNGGPWELLPQLPDMQNGFIDGMFLAADRLVVFGDGGDTNETTVWMSQDGATWTSTTDLVGMDPVTAIAVGPAGFSAFGTYFDESMYDVVLVAATSNDGVHFSPANAPALVGTGIDDLAVGPGGMVGVGYHSIELFNEDGVAVHSTDGLTWTEATNTDGSFSGSSLKNVHSLAAGGYVALGYTPGAGDSFLLDGVAWFSADGSDWKLIGRLDGGFSQLSTSALGPGGVVVFASEQIDIDEDNAGSIIHAWFAPLSLLHA